MKSHYSAIALCALWLGVTSCSDESSTPVDGGIDGKVVDAGRDAAPRDTAPRDHLLPDGPSTDAGAVTNTFGFTMRVPQEHTITCDLGNPAPCPGSDQLVESDMDWICTFSYGGTIGHVYVKATPVECSCFGMTRGATYQGRGSFISINGTVTPTTDATYDMGGGHNNDSMGFSYDGKYFTYFHSSFGSGYRKCQPMDCIQVYDAPAGTLLENGCTPERTLPAVCHQVEPGGSYGEGDFTDTFAKCPGDPN
jgi:hypothetical protein